MNLEFPADARVQIFISAGSAAPFGEPAQIAAIPALPAPVASSKAGRPLLKGAAVILLVAAAFTIGSRAGSHSDPLLARPQASAQEPQAATPPRPGQVPQGFTQQLQQPPGVTPPPGGAADSTAPSKTGFGLED